MTRTAAPEAVGTRRRRRLRPEVRRGVLLTHILAAALWFGVDIALSILLFTAMFGDDPAAVSSALTVAGRIAVWPMAGASLVTLVSGAALGLGSRYGLLRYWWVLLKLVITVVMGLLIMLALRPGLDDAAALAPEVAAGAAVVGLTPELLGPALVAPAMLLTAFVLAVYRRPGRIGGRSGKRP